MHFSLNAETAQDAKDSEKTGGSIREPGLYPGKITQAYKIKSATTGSTGICLSFTSKDGHKADRLEIYTHNAQGEPFAGAKTVYAIMAVLKLRELEPRDGTAEIWQNGGFADAPRTMYPALANRDIGLGLNIEQYEKGDGSLGVKPVVGFPYDLETGRVASEILEKKPKGEKLNAMAAQLYVKPPKKKPGGGYGQSRQPVAAGDDDSDIPF